MKNITYDNSTNRWLVRIKVGRKLVFICRAALYEEAEIALDAALKTKKHCKEHILNSVNAI